jgi:hypothetical protein
MDLLESSSDDEEECNAAAREVHVKSLPKPKEGTANFHKKAILKLVQIPEKQNERAKDHDCARQPETNHRPTKRSKAEQKRPSQYHGQSFHLLRTKDVSDHYNKACVGLEDVIQGDIL